MRMRTVRTSSRAISGTFKDAVEQERDEYDACVRWLKARSAGVVEGFYGPRSMTWQIYREPVVLAGGLRAILLQIAHPGVASGVEHSSNFRNDLLGRARRTFTSMYELIFSDLDGALAASLRLRKLHETVRGRMPGGAGGDVAGQVYRANDWNLGLWVLATLFDTAVLTYSTFIRPLRAAEIEQYYQESKLAAAQFGIHPKHLPEHYPDFQQWFQTKLASAELRVSELARGQAHTLFNSPYTRGQLDELLTAGMLPPAWREAYGLPWNPTREALYKTAVAGLKLSLRLTPPPFRAVPAYHQAQLRLAIARGDSGTLYARLLNQLDGIIDLPMSIRPVATHLVEEDETAQD